MIIEKMNKAHVAAVAELETICFHDPWSEKSIASEMENDLALWLVATEDQQVVGYVGSQTVLGWTDMMNIAVAPEYRGQHLSHLLMKSFLDFAAKSDIRYLTLEVREGNIPARNLYYQYGFQDAGVRKGYYQDNGENAIVMWADLEKKC